MMKRLRMGQSEMRNAVVVLSFLHTMHCCDAGVNVKPTHEAASLHDA